jgi:hypothetical protein
MIAVPPLDARYLTWGPIVAEWAEKRVGLACTPWQRFALDRLLEVDPDRGRLRYRSAIVSCARRNGKSTVLRGPLGWLLDASPLWSLGAITAPTREQAYAALFAQLANDVRPLGMEAQPTGARAGIGYSDDPRRVFMLSGKHDVARGRTFDLVVIDEAQQRGLTSSTIAALEPTTRTREHGLLIATGTAPAEGSELFSTLYARAVMAAARPGDDPRFGALVWEGTTDDDAGIREANPGVRDGLLELDVLRDTRRALSAHAFAAETLNRTSADPTHAWAPPGSWDACADPRGQAPADATPSFGLDVTPAWTRASILAAVPDGERVHVELVDQWPHGADAEEVISAARELLRKYPRSRLAFDAASPIAARARDLVDELPERVEELGGSAFRAACSSLLGHVVAGTLRHRADPVLDSAARLAARSEDAEAWRFVRRKSAGHIDAIVAATCAVHLADRPLPPRPAIYARRG